MCKYEKEIINKTIEAGRQASGNFFSKQSKVHEEKPTKIACDNSKK